MMIGRQKSPGCLEWQTEVDLILLSCALFSFYLFLATVVDGRLKDVAGGTVLYVLYGQIIIA